MSIVSKESQISDLFKEAKEYLHLCRKFDKETSTCTKVYMISRKWVKSWKRHTCYKQYKKRKKSKVLQFEEFPSPGPIDNQSLLIPIGEFYNDEIPERQENKVFSNNIGSRDIKHISKEMWEFFKKRYGGGPEIVKPIKTTTTRAGTKERMIMMFEVSFKVLSLPPISELNQSGIDNLKIEEAFISKQSKMSRFKDFSLSVMKVRGHKKVAGVRIWKFDLGVQEIKTFLKGNLEGLQNKERFLVKEFMFFDFSDEIFDELEIEPTEILLLEHRNEGEEFFLEIDKEGIQEGKCERCKATRTLIYKCACKKTWYCSRGCRVAHVHEHSKVCKQAHDNEEQLVKQNDSKMGIVGLKNLGNTCYMNSALQCISNCWELTNYFLTDSYRQHINTKNPIGWKGALANGYASLIKHLWFGKNSGFSPFSFKKTVDTINSTFEGYNQHDGQEFLIFVLDAIHEDLNKVLKKPLVAPCEEKLADSVKSKIEWNNFLKRNQSLVVDLLYGQFKSELHCPDTSCQNTSVNFDPFLFVSVPLVSTSESCKIKAFFIFYDVTVTPIELQLNFNGDCNIMAVRNKVAKILKVNPFSFVIVKMNSQGEHDHIISSSQLLKTNLDFKHKNEAPFFLFQVNPDLFYSDMNRFHLRFKHLYPRYDFTKAFEMAERQFREVKKLFKSDYEEDETGTTTESLGYYSDQLKQFPKYNTDENNGFGRKALRVLCHLYMQGSKPARIIFARQFFFATQNSLEEVYRTLYGYFFQMLQKSMESADKYDADEYFDKMILPIILDRDFDKLPFIVKIRKIADSKGICVFCGKKCNNCFLPCDKSKLSEIVKKIPGTSQNVDNSYLYLNKSQQKAVDSREFELQLEWLPEMKELVYQLNDKKDLNFERNEQPFPDKIPIDRCFLNFGRREQLDATNEWFCPACKQHQKAFKKMRIYKTPHILIIHLKRFSNSAKVDTLVEFPICGLNLEDLISGDNDHLPAKYDLFGVANHSGGLHSGHYYSYCKNPTTQKWLRYDDNSVSSISHNEIVSRHAYLLFYRRRNLERLIDLEEMYNSGFIDYNNIDVKDIIFSQEMAEQV